MTSPPAPSRSLCLWMVAGSRRRVRRPRRVSLVPWSWVPGGHLVQCAASEVFTAGPAARGARPTPRCSGHSAGHRWRSRSWWRWCSGSPAGLPAGAGCCPGPWWVQGTAGHPGDPAGRCSGHPAVRPRASAGTMLDYGLTRPVARSAGSGTSASRCWSAGSSPAAPCWSCWSPPVGRPGGGRCGPAHRGCRADGARVVGLPRRGRAVVQPLHVVAARRSCAPDILALAEEGARARSPTCWSPTRRVVRRP